MFPITHALPGVRRCTWTPRWGWGACRCRSWTSSGWWSRDPRCRSPGNKREKKKKKTKWQHWLFENHHHSLRTMIITLFFLFFFAFFGETLLFCDIHVSLPPPPPRWQPWPFPSHLVLVVGSLARARRLQHLRRLLGGGEAVVLRGGGGGGGGEINQGCLKKSRSRCDFANFFLAPQAITNFKKVNHKADPTPTPEEKKIAMNNDCKSQPLRVFFFRHLLKKGWIIRI